MGVDFRLPRLAHMMEWSAMHLLRRRLKTLSNSDLSEPFGKAIYEARRQYISPELESPMLRAPPCRCTDQEEACSSFFQKVQEAQDDERAQSAEYAIYASSGIFKIAIYKSDTIPKRDPA